MPMRTTAQTLHRHMEAWKHSTRGAQRPQRAHTHDSQHAHAHAAAVRVRAGDALGDS